MVELSKNKVLIVHCYVKPPQSNLDIWPPRHNWAFFVPLYMFYYILSHILLVSCSLI